MNLFTSFIIFVFGVLTIAIGTGMLMLSLTYLLIG